MEDQIENSPPHTSRVINILMRCAYIVVIAVSVYTGATYVGKTLEEKNKVLQTEEIARMNSTCPTLLSISRTPRDTLLVMRSEKICITYVMSTLK